VHYAIPHAVSAFLARSMCGGKCLRFVTTLHGTDITVVGQDPSFQSITRFSIEKSDRITAVSEFLRGETFHAFGCTGCDVRVIHNFVDPVVYDRKRYKPLLREQFGNKQCVVMHVSNFRAVKRVRDVVRIFARIRESVPAVLVMVGDGPDRAQAEEEARSLGVHEAVHFLGKLDVVAPLLAGADLFLLPSQSESVGLSALEALASGVPVVATRAGGLVEVVREGETGYLCEVGDVDGMARAAVSVLTDREAWKSMSTAGESDARSRFSRDEIVSAYERLYGDALTQ
jgi:N-acetyl-alpha-D-glucosaminyl L-malate synthase BshA